MCAEATSSELRSTLETLSDRAVPGTDRLALGSWRLRSGSGVTGRANSTWAPGPPSGSVLDALDEVEAWYRSQGLQPRFQIFDGTSPELVAELDRRGWLTTVDSLVMIGPTAVVADRTRPPSGIVRTIEISSEPTASFARLLDDDGRLAEVTATDLPQRVVTVFDGEELLGGGMATIDGRWAAVGSMNTQPHARRRGVAATTLRTLAGAVDGLAVDTMWLQVQSDNEAAVALYRGVGFEAVHRYRYRIAPDR